MGDRHAPGSFFYSISPEGVGFGIAARLLPPEMIGGEDVCWCFLGIIVHTYGPCHTRALRCTRAELTLRCTGLDAERNAAQLFAARLVHLLAGQASTEIISDPWREGRESKESIGD